MQLVLFLALLVSSAFFSSSETVVFSLGSHHLPGDPRLARLSERPLRFLAFILLGNNLVNAALAALSTSVILSLWGESALALGAALLTIILMLFGEILPKTVAASAHVRLAPFLAGPLTFLYRLFSPLASLLSFAADGLLGRFFGQDKEERPALSSLELAHAAAEGTALGLLSPREEEILGGILSFSQKTAGEVMTPRPYMVAIPLETSLSKAAEVFRRQGLSRLPVFHQTLDAIAGVLYAKDLLRTLALAEAKTVAQLLRPIFFVPEGIRLFRLMAELRSRQTHLALVVDEYGGTSGVITLEDILEEIVGEIWDEHDPLVFHDRRLRDGSWLIRADINGEDMAELGLQLPGSYDNLASYLLEVSGHIPQKGERFTLGDWHLQVVGATPQRCELIRASHV
jgi:putative hemolysin